jgi:hypothetical protein
MPSLRLLMVNLRHRQTRRQAYLMPWGMGGWPDMRT